MISVLQQGAIQHPVIYMRNKLLLLEIQIDQFLLDWNGTDINQFCFNCKVLYSSCCTNFLYTQFSLHYQ